jgi:glutathione peroxidase
MKSLLAVIGLVLLTGFGTVNAKDIYKYDLKNEKGEILSLSQFKGKTLLIVNIATKCGLTGQLDDLEKLYQQYKDKNFIILGIPSNDFLGQTPESNEEVVKFCRLKYGVSFPITAKEVVKGKTRHPLYTDLITASPTLGPEINWNFEKFLIDKNGKVQGRFNPKTVPLDKSLTSKIEEIL